MDWRLRRAGPGDADALALAGAATFLETFAYALPGPDILAHCARAHAAEAYRRYLADPRSAAWLIEAALGAPIGYALLTPPDLPGVDPASGDLELKRIYTLSLLHGGGAGGALMQAAVDHASAAGARRLHLGVYDRNLRAIAFYRRQGFAVTATRTFRVGALDCDDLVLSRVL